MNRTMLKGPKTKKILCLKCKNKKEIKKAPRQSIIISSLVGYHFKIYNGNMFFTLKVTDNMIGFKFGEFCPTRKDFLFKRRKKRRN